MTKEAVDLWVVTPLSLGTLYATIAFGIIYKHTGYNRAKVISQVVRAFASLLFIRVVIINTLWTVRAFLGPLPVQTAYLKVVVERITIFGLFSTSMSLALVRCVYYYNGRLMEVNIQRK